MFKLLKTFLIRTIGVADDASAILEAGSASLRAHAQHLRACDEVSMLEGRAYLLKQINSIPQEDRVTISELYSALGITR